MKQIQNSFHYIHKIDLAKSHTHPDLPAFHICIILCYKWIFQLVRFYGIYSQVFGK